MQIYSVWKPGERVYDYYQTGEPITDDTPSPTRSGGSQLGYAPNEIGWKLPAHARPVGRGALPKGIVVHNSSLSGWSFDSDFFKWALIGGAVLAIADYLVWHKIFK